MRTKIINETIVVANTGDAKCRQEITYQNTGEKPIDFRGPSRFYFHKDCDSFSFTGNDGLISPKVLDIVEEPYHKKVDFLLSGTIPPAKAAKLSLEYTWKGFRTSTGFKRIATKFDSLTDYNLRVVVEDDTFTDHLISVSDGQHYINRGQGYNVTIEGHLVISRQHLSPNDQMDIRINAIIRKIDLPVVRDVAKNYANCLANHTVLVIIHLLRDSLPFFDALLTMGLKKDDIFIIGIPYSSKDEVVEHLTYDRYQVFKADKAKYDEFTNIVKDVLTTILDHCRRNAQKFLIIEDGGYAVPLLHKDFKNSLTLCVGAVEQTANGIWADRELEESGDLSFPVMNVAEASIKNERESPLVGQAIIQNINRLLDGYGYGLGSMKVGQIGYGAIGAALAHQMIDDGVDLTVYDADPERLKLAKSKEVNIADDYEDLLKRKTLVIGCTGKEWFGIDELRQLDRNIFFVNATSKLRELKYKEFTESAEKVKLRKGVGTEYRLKGGRQITITLLADGFPVNFFESSESIPDREIQFIPALLLAAAGYLMREQINESKIVRVPEELEEELAHLMDVHDYSQ